MTEADATDEIRPDAPDRGTPKVKARREKNALLTLLPVAIIILVLFGIVFAGWFAWHTHSEAQSQTAEAAGNVASKTSIGKQRNDYIPEPSRRLGADGEDPLNSADAPQVPAIAQDNPRQNTHGQTQPIPVQGQGNAEPPPRSRYDAPMQVDTTPPGFGGRPGVIPAPGVTKATPATRPDYSAPPPGLGASSASARDFSSAMPAGKGQLNLQTLKTPKAEASLIGNRDFLLVKGASMDVDLDTAIRSNQPGMVRGTLVKDVWSDNGSVVLAERGSTLTGEYSATVQQGQAEIQVIWNRIKTPEGVIVDLASPATDALGRAGIDGTVDNHWGQRIGAAFLLSIVKDAIGYATAVNGSDSSTTGNVYQNSTQTGESMADTILKQTINIPPTIERAQGTRVKVFVARDLDFSKVYELRLRNNPE